MKEIQLTKEKVALVDDEDFDRVNAHKRYASLDSRGTKWYAKRRTKKSEKGRWKAQSIRMSHFVLDVTPDELPPGHVVDHRDRDGLNNQKKNFRIVTQLESMLSSPGWKRKAEEPWL